MSREALARAWAAGAGPPIFEQSQAVETIDLDSTHDMVAACRDQLVRYHP